MSVSLGLFASTPDIAELGFVVKVLTGSIEALPKIAVEWGYRGIEFMPDPERIPNPGLPDQAIRSSDSNRCCGPRTFKLRRERLRMRRCVSALE
jgi:hypothetical protein